MPFDRDGMPPPEALFPVYSVTKTLLAAAVMLLGDAGASASTSRSGSCFPTWTSRCR